MKQASSGLGSAVEDRLTAIHLFGGLAWTVIEFWLTFHSGPMKGLFKAAHIPALIGRRILELPTSAWELMPRTWLLGVSVTAASFAEVCLMSYLSFRVLTIFKRHREQASNKTS